MQIVWRNDDVAFVIVFFLISVRRLEMLHHLLEPENHERVRTRSAGILLGLRRKRGMEAQQIDRSNDLVESAQR